ncbi:hypothetical protein PMZ80_001609 [Knufia obscura]|uniref:Putative transcription factor kapC n=1 Tax=Knufia obscura TaxID=1635080 RepID=A0ABR0S3M4_9EURO|nr:hypothetical protein PMZ80_001609 [Knufia obscura]
MDFHGYVSSPSASPSNTIFSNGLYFDSNSDSSSPNSPHVNQMTFGGSIPYEMYQYSATPANFYPAQTSSKIPVELTSSALDEKDRRRKRSDASKSGAEHATTPNMHLRRRAQNRASQRAFRERKEKHVKGLEHQLEELHEKHQDLLQSYTKQADEVSRLNSRIAELSTELTAVRHCQDSSFGDLMISDKFDKFDAFSSTDMIYNPSDTYYDKGPIDLNSEFALHSFEDSL